MQLFAGIALGVILGGAVAAWLVGRWRSTAGGATSLLTDVLGRAAAVVILFWMTMRVASHGGPFIVLAVPLGLFTIAMAALTAIRLFGLVLVLTGRIPENGETAVRR
jgi:hypothetical protein